MKKISLLIILAIVIASITVYGEGAKVPASTPAIVKAGLVTEVTLPANTKGAIITPVINVECYTEVKDLRLAEIHWADDETFYAVGYKALLNGTPDEIIAPPDNR